MADRLPDDERELKAWREHGKAPAGSCPYCASRISMIQRDGLFRARCSHRGCGATGPKMRSITRAADLFCCPPQRTAAGSTPATVARPISEWHEDRGSALWWRFPVEEPPYSGSPLDSDWPGYHTHWTPIVCPDDPASRGPIGEG